MKQKTQSYIVYTALVLLVGMIFWQCSDIKNPMPSKTHTEDWSNSQAEDFHGAKVSAVGSSSCKSCHGNDFSGGESGVSCYTCHNNFPHPAEWMVIDNDMFHGEYIEDNGDSTKGCTNCHGSNLSGGSSGVSCYSCHKPGQIP